MIERVFCETPDEFQSKLSACEVSAGKRPLFILFTGSKDIVTGKSWCPDCVVADPVIDEILNSLEDGCMLLYCSVDREPYRTPVYPYRTHPIIQLKCVPTLIKYQNGKVIARLNDSQCQEKGFVQDLVDA